MGTLGHVQAHAATDDTANATQSTAKTAESVTSPAKQSTVTLAPKATVVDHTTTSTKNVNKQSAGETNQVEKPAQPAAQVKSQPAAQAKPQADPTPAPAPKSAPAAPAAAQPTPAATPTNQGTTQPTQQRAMVTSLSLNTPAPNDQTLDEWMPDKNFQQVVLAAFQAQQRQTKADLLNKYESIRWSPQSTDAQKAEAQAKIDEANNIQLFTDVSQITKDNMATLINFDPAYRRSPNGAPADIERGAGYQGTLDFTSIQGLEYATKLQNLSLSTSDPDPDNWQRGAFSDLSQLATLHLDNLISLDVSETSVSDLTPVMKLPKLTTIYANNDLITSLTPQGKVLAGGSDSQLVPFSQLTHLEIDNNQLTSLAGLEGATHLTELSAQNNTILNVEALANVTGPMTMLFLGDNAIHDLSPLAKVQLASQLYADNQSVVLADDETVTVDPTTDSVVTPSPILNQAGQPVSMLAYLGGAVAKTSLRADPTDQAATKINWRGVTKYGHKYLIVQWDDGQDFSGNLYMPYKLATPATTTTPTTPVTPVTAPSTQPEEPTQPAPTFAKPAFKPFMIYTKQALYRYAKPTFKGKGRLKFYRRYSRQTAPTFKVVGVKRSANGRLRYKLADGSYVTARKAFVYNLYWQGKRYTKIRLDRTVYQYKRTKFAKVNRQKRLKKGTLVTVKRVVHRGYMTRYQLSNGSYITGNKQFITPRR